MEMEIKIRISEEIFGRFEKISVGYLIAINIYNQSYSNEINDKISKYSDALKEIESIDSHLPILKWREMYSKMNAKKGKLSSIESLLKMYSENGSLPSINPIVDYYNSISCFLGNPMGAYNINAISDSEITLREAKKGEEFIPIGGKLIEKTSNGEIIYSAGNVVICKTWNNKDSNLTKIEKDCTDILFIFDGSDEEQKVTMRRGIEILERELPILFNAIVITSGILEKENTVANISYPQVR
jgi:DNA/RNA-binding domain of Phe-tRNA-synthetase-like protein